MTIVTAASYHPVTLDEAKYHLRVYHSNQDSLITAKLYQAEEMVENYCNHFMAEKEICKYYDGFSPLGKPIDLLPGPVNSISKVEYLVDDSDAAYTTLAAASYRLTQSGMRFSVVPIDSWPAVAAINGSVKITFKAGYSSTSNVPLSLKAGLYMILSNLYDNPGDQVVGRQVAQLPKGFEFVVSSQIYRNV